MSDKIKRFSSFLIINLSILLCFSICIPYTVSSESSQLHSINLICRKDNLILKGMKWDLYKIGKRLDGNILLTGDFSEYPIDMSDISEENVELKAKTLESYAVADRIIPTDSGKINEQGEITFSSLDQGIYLAVGQNLNIDYVTYVPSSLLFEVSGNDISFSYDAFPKFMYATLSGEVTSYTVRKVWVNNTDESISHPTEVTVDLFKNGDLYDTVILNDANNWKHQWFDLDNTNRWHIVERKIPAKYTVLIDFNSTQYLIQNSYTPTNTSSSSTNVTTSTFTSTGTSLTTTSSITSTKTTASVPPETVTMLHPLAQTGQLWWPVLAFFIAGLLLLIIGLSISSKKSNK